MPEDFGAIGGNEEESRVGLDIEMNDNGLKARGLILGEFRRTAGPDGAVDKVPAGKVPEGVGIQNLAGKPVRSDRPALTKEGDVKMGS